VSPSRLVALSAEECLSRLGRVHIGRISFWDDDGPAVLPMNYALLEDDVVFRTASQTVIRAARDGAEMAFEIDGFDPLYHGGWDVLVRGRAELVTDPAELRRCRALPLEPWAGPEPDQVVRIRRQAVSGRQIAVTAG